ncbi:MAG: class I SAM-dependent methyltransferase [Candidatus Geothermarchaeales archaeon]
MHWRFVCEVCGRPRHFNGVSWCPEEGAFLCVYCASSFRAVREAFWAWDYYYSLECVFCEESHAALDRLEFEHRHPWLLNPEMVQRLVGLSQDKGIEGDLSLESLSLAEHPISEDEISRQWDESAERWLRSYTDRGDINREHVVDPVIFRMLGDVGDRRILDAGCGGGYLSRLLAARGAVVTGVDISQGLIQHAIEAERSSPLGIKYLVGSITRLDELDDSSFDAVVSNIVLQDTSDYRGAISEFHRVLRPGGRLVLSIIHPCFASSSVSGWEKVPPDSKRNEDRLYYKVDRYFDRTREIWKWRDIGPLTTFHRPLSDYMKALIRTGFVITDFEEPLPEREAVADHPQFMNNYDRIPDFLVIGAEKE